MTSLTGLSGEFPMKLSLMWIGMTSLTIAFRSIGEAELQSFPWWLCRNGKFAFNMTFLTILFYPLMRSS